MLDNKYKVSIIVPIFNVGKYLEKLIESLICQTYNNVEIILINDGSTDNCVEICNKYALQDSRIRVIHQANLGGCAARNVGLKMATGDYVMFVDGDDWLAVDAVEYLLTLAIKNDADIAVSLMNYTTRDLCQTNTPFISGIWSPEDAIVHYLYLRTAMGCWNKLFKTQLIKSNNISFDVPWYGEGMYFISMAFSYSNYIAYGNKKIYYYRMNNPSSAVTIYNVKNAQNALWNILNIKHKIRVRTPRVMNCINWHIWLNHYLLLMHIVATKSTIKNFISVLKIIFTLPILLPNILLRAEISQYDKLLLIKKSFIPIMYIKKEISNKQKLLKQDIDNWNNN